MSAYDSAAWYMLGVMFCYVALLVTILGTRPQKWFELAACFVVVWPMLIAWRRAA